MFRVLVTICALVGVATTLQCYSCDSFLNCNSPFPVNCPPHSKCYTLTKHGGQEVVGKGCAHSCDSLSFQDRAYCQICSHNDFCNGPEPGIGQGVVMRQPPAFIGGGVQPDNGGYQIGRGVVPRSSTQASFGVLMALPAIRRFVL